MKKGCNLKNKKLFLFGAFLFSSGLIFSAQANESDIISEVDAEPMIVEISPLEMTDVVTSTVTESNLLDDGSNNSGTYHIGEGDIGEGDIGQPIPGVNDVNVQSPSEDKPVKTEKAPDIMVDYKQVKFEPLNYQQQANRTNTYVEENEPIDLNYNVDDVKEKKQEVVDSVSSVKEEEPVEVSTANEQPIVEKQSVSEAKSDEVDTEKVGKLIDLRQEDKPIGKITRLKAELPLTGMMNTKQGIVASLILMLSGLISLLYGFSRKYLG